MNQRQRLTIFIGSLAVVVMLLFPPMSGQRHPAYLFVFSKRTTYFADLDLQPRTGQFLPEFNGWVSWRINQERLTFQILIVVSLTVGITVLLGGKRV